VARREEPYVRRGERTKCLRHGGRETPTSQSVQKRVVENREVSWKMGKHDCIGRMGTITTKEELGTFFDKSSQE